MHVDDVVLDDATLARLRRFGGERLVEQLSALFLENAPQRIESARAAYRAGDLVAVARATHSLKSTAGNLGARALQELAGEIERRATQQQEDRLASLLDELEAAFERVRDRLGARARGVDE